MSETRRDGNLYGYSLGDVDSVRMNIIDEMGHESPVRRATARLGRDILSVMEQWTNEEMSQIDPIDMMDAAMHGTLSICGTILVNMPPKKRPEVHRLMRDRLVAMFDEMGTATAKD